MYKRYVRDFDSTHLVIKFLEGAKPEFRVHIDVRPSLLPHSSTVVPSAICWAVPWVRSCRVFNSALATASSSQKFENEEKSRSGLLLNSFLILPVQRVPRYMLLLQVQCPPPCPGLVTHTD